MIKWKNRVILTFSGISFLITFTLLLVIQFSDGGDMKKYKKEISGRTAGLMDTAENNIDWKKLQDVNPDVYAWLSVPGTNIDYPVLESRTESRDFYLHHDIHKKFSFAGSIYSRSENNMNFTDAVTVLYGHNMRNGSMFADIKKFEDKAFFDKHSRITVYLPDRTLHYQIVSIYHTDDKDMLSKAQNIKEYKKEVLCPGNGNGQARKGISKVDSRILTLSTCASEEKERRVLQSVLVKEIKLEK